MNSGLNPKVFISYSWTSPDHRERVREWAERLMSDGVDVVLDIWALKEGHDKYAFMERMVTDESVTHVLIFSDRKYAEKADERKAGVGTESQIISKEVYDKVDQTKFIPILCERQENDEPCLPTFLKSRTYIDFSSLERENENWERLVRRLFGKPEYEKPSLGKPPAYIREHSAAPASPAVSKFNVLRQAVLQGKRVGLYRRDFLDACIAHADALRVRERPNIETLREKALEDCRKLKSVRDHITDWVLLEADSTESAEFTKELLKLLERLLELKERPAELTGWNEAWFEGHACFVYETFLYIIAALIKIDSFDVLGEVFRNHYLVPETALYKSSDFDRFGRFWAKSWKSDVSQAGGFLRDQADREDLPFVEIVQAELLVFLMACVIPDTRWYPQTCLGMVRGSRFPLFVRAATHKHFMTLASLTGVPDAEQLREKVQMKMERLQNNNPLGYLFATGLLWRALNMDALDTLA